MSAGSSMDDLPIDIISIIIDRLDYFSLCKFAVTSKRNRDIVTGRMRALLALSRSTFGKVAEGISDNEVIERVFYLNDYQKCPFDMMLKWITITDATWSKGTNKITPTDWMSKDLLHRIDGPAHTSWHNNGQKSEEHWLINGKFHRDRAPAWSAWYACGQKKEERWYSAGKCHRVGGPAQSEWYEDGQKKGEQWYSDDKHHRNGGPAWSEWYANGLKKEKWWYSDNKLHRKGGPARSEWYEDGQKKMEMWTIHGILHRYDGPAQTTWHNNGTKDELWYNDGYLYHIR